MSTRHTKDRKQHPVLRVCKEKLSAEMRSSQTRPLCILVISFTAGKKPDVPVHNFRINTSLLSYCEMIIWITFLLLTTWPGVWHKHMIIFNSKNLLSIIRWSRHEKRCDNGLLFQNGWGLLFCAAQHGDGHICLSAVPPPPPPPAVLQHQFHSQTCCSRQFFGLSSYHSSSRGEWDGVFTMSQAGLLWYA